MNAEQSTSEQEVVPACRLLQYRYSILTVGLTVGVSLALIVFVRPRVGPWLEVRAAYRNLSSADSDARTNAIRRLRSAGKEAESELIALLRHPDAGVRRFASGELANRTPVTDEIIEAFLSALEGNQYAAEISHSAPKLFFRHAEVATGPLTETDRRMIAWLRSELDSTNPDRCGLAAWGLTAFVNRDPSLRESLTTYLKQGAWFYKYVVLREMVDSDPSLRDPYVDVLLSGLGSSVHSDQVNARYGLTNWKNAPDDLRWRLEAQRAESSDPQEVMRIEQALEELGKDVDEP